MPAQTDVDRLIHSLYIKEYYYYYQIALKCTDGDTQSVY